MGFSEADITSVAKPSFESGQMFLRWTSTAPAGTWYQVYVARQLAWYTRATSCTIPVPAGRGRINIGTVADGEQQTDFSSSLPSAPNNRVRMSWLGGTFEGEDIASYRIYSEPSPGAGIDYAKPVGTVAAYPGGFIQDGWGLGGWDEGGWGFASSAYEWTSEPTTSGVWAFAIRPVDSAGNEGAGSAGTVAVSIPPLPPARNADYSRLEYSYDPATKRITLNWNPSPG